MITEWVTMFSGNGVFRVTKSATPEQDARLGAARALPNRPDRTCESVAPITKSASKSPAVDLTKPFRIDVTFVLVMTFAPDSEAKRPSARTIS